MKTAEKLKEQFKEVLEEFVGYKDIGEDPQERAESAEEIGRALDRLTNIAQTYYDAPAGLVELRGHLGKCAFDMDPEKPLIEVKVTLAKNMDNLMALAMMGNSVTVRGLQLDLEKASMATAAAEHPGQGDLVEHIEEQEAAASVDVLGRRYQDEDGNVYGVVRHTAEGKEPYYMVEFGDPAEPDDMLVLWNTEFESAEEAQAALDDFARELEYGEYVDAADAEPPKPEDVTEIEAEPDPGSETEDEPEPEPEPKPKRGRRGAKGSRQ